MVTITIPKREYERLVEKGLRYEYFRQLMQEDIFSPPPTRNIRQIIAQFKATGKYSRNFLNRLEKGLKRSTHFSV